ncbi:MAG: hypothetical protein M8865_06600 [marine benthic group bacterium]|nr:hypothetical protein [Gemmatimonadota bacterium]
MNRRNSSALSLAFVAALGAAATSSGAWATADVLPPGFQWFWVLNGPISADAGTDLVMDEDGNIFLGGYTGGVDVDRDGTLDLTTEGADALFMKLTPAGPGERPRPVWMKSARVSNFEYTASVAPDRAGGMYGVGRFQQKVSFGEGAALSGRGKNDAYIVRFAADGSLAWARVFGGPGEDALNAVASDLNGNLYVVGWGEGSFPLDGGKEFPGGDGQSGAIVSYDPDGNVRWVHAIASPNRILFSAEVSDGGLFVSGFLEGEADLDADGRVDVRAPTERDGFVARLDLDGRVLAAWPIASQGKTASLPDGDVLVLGAFGGQAEELFGPADFDGDGTPELVSRTGEMRSWIARYSRDGELRWLRGYELEIAADIETDGQRIIVPGGYHGVLDLDEDGVPERVDHRSDDASFNSEMGTLVVSAEDGEPELVWTAPGPGKDQASAALIVPGSRTVYLTGFLQLTADFTGDGEDGEGWVQCQAVGDLFFAGYELPLALRLPGIDQ